MLPHRSVPLLTARLHFIPITCLPRSAPPRHLSAHFRRFAASTTSRQLHHHSTYFRAYFDTLASSHSGPSSASSGSAEFCNHQSITHCIHLPHQTKLVEAGAVTAADFRLFLSHLYFGVQYCYPPYLPTSDVDLDEPPFVSLHFPILSWKEFGRCDRYSALLESLLRQGGVDGSAKLFVCNGALLTLAHYLDCDQLVRRCDVVLLAMLSGV